MKKSILFIIKLYKLTNVVRQPCCRFYPTCSNYAYEAIDKCGVLKGIVKTIIRLLKCNPLHPGGIDWLDKSKT